jgi:hypothetical protein
MKFSLNKNKDFSCKLSDNANASNKVPQFNPGRFSSALIEKYYSKTLGLGAGRTELVDWLRKKHESDEASMNLADRLEACKPDRRCWSAACPKCSYAAQTFTTEVAVKFLTSHQDRNKIVCVSVVPADGDIPQGKLSSDQHARNVRRWKEALRRAGVTWFIGATDWSFNEHNGGRYKPSWQEHFYGFTATDDPKELKKKLKEQFPTTDSIPRPVRVKVWDEDPTAIEYMLKPIFWRRIGTDEGQRCEKDSTEKRECRATDKQPLRSAEKHELLMFLDKIGIQGRFLMRWLQFTNLRGSGWTIVDRAPKGRMHGNGGSMQLKRQTS